MAFTMHSHSGQFCPGHAKDQLEEIIQHAIKLGFKTMGLSEHMPRTDVMDLYPEELLPSPQESLAALAPRHEAYLSEATRLRDAYADRMHILVGFETEFLRPGDYAPLIRHLAAHPDVEYVVGSLHHVRGVPIDFNREMYAAAVRACNGGGGEGSDGGEEEYEDSEEEALWMAYLDEQLAMLKAVKPRVVGHFDVVRLLSKQPQRDLRTAWGQGQGQGQGDDGVWSRVLRNLEAVREYGGWLECNTSALRKGLPEPYPKREIAEAWLAMGGRFTFSDDSHGIAQVGTNYLKGLEYLEGLGVKEVWTLERQAAEDGGKGKLVEKAVSIDEFRASLVLEEAQGA
ncbi:hypothetical protein VTJ49DRAFT_5080 [Mycothermus thermophilus]|uniref:Histidinol-phosphatase n=1 Tax=Humicola insolens TaxID=85995 RepID=A0ABR3V594_HUMIN